MVINWMIQDQTEFTEDNSHRCDTSENYFKCFPGLKLRRKFHVRPLLI